MSRRPTTPGARKRPRRSAREPSPIYGRRQRPVEVQPLIAAFETSAPDIRRAPQDQGREVAFAGRSNAGKSSVLNRVAGQRSLARTSGTPGRTQLLNFFLVDPPADEDPEDPAAVPRRLVDLPGYGYARTDHATRRAWQAHVEEYLAARQTLVGVVLVMDIRHPFQEFDEHMVAWARESSLPLLILINKADKLGQGAIGLALREAQAHVADLPNVQVVAFSALRGQGAAEVLAILRAWLCLPAVGDAGGTLEPEAHAEEPQQP
ncbi:MAG TPA: ribosome biogenesis GTP-binding protein YihA/YsxC [Pseudomonadales bacterium]|nr:ribosome biogenesis GTP-binding protein YihA/YsxC [Pseudomonadales bacterium]